MHVQIRVIGQCFVDIQLDRAHSTANDTTAATTTIKLIRSKECPTVPQELLISGSTLICRSGGVIRKTISLVDSPIIDALYASFQIQPDQSSGSSPSLSRNSRLSKLDNISLKAAAVKSSITDANNACTSKLKEALLVVSAGTLWFYFHGQQNIQVSLPFPVRRVWPLASGGILLERRMLSYCPRTLDGSTLFYIIRHPLDLIQPVSVVGMPSDSPDSNVAASVSHRPLHAFNPANKADLGVAAIDTALNSMANDSPQYIVVYVSDDFGTGLPDVVVLYHASSLSIHVFALKSSQFQMSTDFSSPLDKTDQSRSTPTTNIPSSAQSDFVPSLSIQDHHLFASSDILEPIWKAKLPFDGVPDSCFVAHGSKNERVLWVFNKSAEVAIVFELDTINPHSFGTFSAKNAVPVKCTRRLYTDALLTTEGHNVLIWFGTQKLISCSLPDNFKDQIEESGSKNKRQRSRKNQSYHSHTTLIKHSPSKSRRESSHQPFASSHMFDITHWFDSTIIMRLSNGEYICTDFSFYTQSTLVSSAFQAIKSVVSADQFAQLFSRFITYCNSNRALHPFGYSLKRSSYQQVSDINTPLKLMASNIDALEFEFFMITLLSFFHKFESSMPSYYSTGVEEHMKSTLNSNAEHEDWEWFCKQCDTSKTHRSLPALVNEEFHRGDSTTFQLNDSFNLYKVFSESWSLYSLFKMESSLCKDIGNIVMVLHAVYEDHKLSPAFASHARNLGCFLCSISGAFGWHSYIDYYFRDGIVTPPLPIQVLNCPSEPSPPIDIFAWVLQRIKCANEDRIEIFGPLKTICCYEILQISCSRISKIVQLYNALYSLYTVASSDTAKDACIPPLLRIMSDLKFSLTDLDELPVGISLPLREALHEYRTTLLCDNLNFHQLKLLGRDDIATQRFHNLLPKNKSLMKFRCEEPTLMATLVEDIHQTVADGRDPSIPLYRATDTDCDTVMKLRFGSKQGLVTAMKLLHPSGSHEITLAVASDASEENVLAQQQAHLFSIASREWPVAIGRGMLLAYSRHIMPTEFLDIPSVSISARFFPMQVDITLDLQPSNQSIPNAREWAEFHAGVASGMQVSGDSAFVDSSWLVFNQHLTTGPLGIDAKHGGLVVGFGLNAHLEKLSYVVILNHYLKKQHTMGTAGMLFGLAVSYIGSQNTQFTSVLSTHIPDFHPQNATDLKTAPMVTSVCMLGYGLVYMGSSSRECIDEIFCGLYKQQLSQLDEQNSQRECYAISCGFALGFVLLKHNESDAGMKSGPRNVPIVDHDPLSDQLFSLINGKGTELTLAPGLIALGLAYLKSNNIALSNRIELPSSVYMLDFFRPDTLQLRVIARSLIMWDSIDPSLAWMHSLVPDFILERMAKLSGILPSAQGQDSVYISVDMNSSSGEWCIYVIQAYLYIMAGSCLCLALKFAGSWDKRAYTAIEPFMQKCLQLISGARGNISSHDNFMIRLAAQSALNVVCTSMGAIMAGSGDENLVKYFKQFSERTQSENAYGQHMAIGMATGFLFLGKGKLTLGTSNVAIAGLLCSLYPTYPSTVDDNRSHNQAFRHLWTLAIEKRCLVVRDVDTREPISVQVNVSVASSTDSTKTSVFQMQSPCILPYLAQVKSIAVNSPRYWPVTVDFQSLSETEKQTLLNGLWVKRKTGHLPYSMDPHGHNSILMWTVPRLGDFLSDTDIQQIQTVWESLPQSFSADPQVFSFVQHFCDIQADEPSEFQKAEFFMHILHECLTLDKPELIQTYMWLNETINGVEQKTSSPESIWSLVLVAAHYSARYQRVLDLFSDPNNRQTCSDSINGKNFEWTDVVEAVKQVQSRNLIKQSFVDAISKRIDTFLNSSAVDTLGQSGFCASMTFYLKKALEPMPVGTNGYATNAISPMFGSYLIAKGIPSLAKLRQLQNQLSQFSKQHPTTISANELILFGHMIDPDCPDVVLQCMHALLK
ncbi:Anaphase-promoting complex subunit 1 [Batrachochytrium dendrobatidis]|nr:Anaphase-promoting complex subunit 1 [Batrachochytrium dendrobatidis]KAK5668721.1 Anaphase-promoting complex subunit 1 [Batrachochytrium dendrobatidis]